MTDEDAGSLVSTEARAWLSQAASLGLHATLMALMALLVPPAMLDGESKDPDIEWIQHLALSMGQGPDDPRYGSGTDPEAPGPRSEPLHGSAAAPFDGARTTTEAKTERAESRPVREQAALFGMIGLLSEGAAGEGRAEGSPWARPEGPGQGGTLWGDAIGDGFGIGWVGLSGIGEGGGGRGEGIAIGEVGGLGHAGGLGEGQGFGCGCGRGRAGGSHTTRAPVLRCGPPPGALGQDDESSCAATVHGRLPPEAVQRVVRASFGRFRLCYEEGLRLRTGLAGRVAVKFVIDREGAVSAAADAGSDLPDERVVACVVRAFGGLSFPQPEGGVVTVVYPLVLAPAG